MGKDAKIKERISYLRRGKKLSQEKMAQSLKISLNSYRKLEGGPTRLVNQYVEQIALLLDVSPDYLLSDSGEDHSYDMKDRIEALASENIRLRALIDELTSKIKIQTELLKQYTKSGK